MGTKQDIERLKLAQDDALAESIALWRDSSDPKLHNRIKLNDPARGWQDGDDPEWWRPPHELFPAWGPGWWSMDGVDGYRCGYSCREDTAIKDFSCWYRHKLGRQPSAADKERILNGRYWIKTTEHGVVELRDGVGPWSPPNTTPRRGSGRMVDKGLNQKVGGDWMFKLQYPLLDGKAVYKGGKLQHTVMHILAMWSNLIGDSVFRYPLREHRAYDSGYKGSGSGRFLTAENSFTIVYVQTGTDHDH